MAGLPLFDTPSDTDRVLSVLREFRDRPDPWVDHPYRRLSVMWHSRIADLRRHGHQIECKRFGSDYRYRLLREPGEVQ